MSTATRTAAITEFVPRQLEAVALVYPLPETLQIRELSNAVRWSKADIDLGHLIEVLILNRLMSPQAPYHVGAQASQTVVMPIFGLHVEPLSASMIRRRPFPSG